MFLFKNICNLVHSTQNVNRQVRDAFQKTQTGSLPGDGALLPCFQPYRPERLRDVRGPGWNDEGRGIRSGRFVQQQRPPDALRPARAAGALARRRLPRLPGCLFRLHRPESFAGRHPGQGRFQGDFS